MGDSSSVIVKLVFDKHVANSMENNVEHEIDDSKPTKVPNSSDNDLDVIDGRLNGEFTDEDENQRSLVNHGDHDRTISGGVGDKGETD